MGVHQVRAEEFVEFAAEYVRRVEEAGESFTVTRAGQPVAVLAPVHRGVRARDLPALLAAVPRMSDEEWASVAADLEDARAAASDGDLRDPWAS